MGVGAFFDHGWMRFEQDPQTLDWANYIRPTAENICNDTKNRQAWLRHGETWFAGVNILDNDGIGCVGNGPKLAGPAFDFAQQLSGSVALDKAQISTIYPGYPLRDQAETEGAYRYRKLRDAAHVDGLRPVGAQRRRFVHEPHGYVLGIPLTPVSGGASPMVVWDKSHHIIRDAFLSVLDEVPVDEWPEVDLTDIYNVARKTCFETCERVEVEAQPGEAYVLHRLALHGMAPWADEATAPECGRMIAYFRPDVPGGLGDWLRMP